MAASRAKTAGSSATLRLRGSRTRAGHPRLALMRIPGTRQAGNARTNRITWLGESQMQHNSLRRTPIARTQWPIAFQLNR